MSLFKQLFQFVPEEDLVDQLRLYPKCCKLQSNIYKSQKRTICGTNSAFLLFKFLSHLIQRKRALFKLLFQFDPVTFKFVPAQQRRDKFVFNFFESVRLAVPKAIPGSNQWLFICTCNHASGDLTQDRRLAYTIEIHTCYMKNSVLVGFFWF